MSYTQLSNAHRKAHKQYQCIWCGELIPLHSIYHWKTGIYDGDFQTQRKHLECERATKEFDWHNNDYYFEEFEFYRGTPISKGWEDELAEYLFGDAKCI